MAKTGRNEPCPCGSGKKYKRCCMDKDERAAWELRKQELAARAELPHVHGPGCDHDHHH